LNFKRSEKSLLSSYKGKIVPVLLTEHDVMKAYWGSGGIDPNILWPRH